MLDEDKLKRVMSQILGIEPDLINEDASTDTLAAWTSLRHMNLVLALEEAFNVQIPDEDAANITSWPLVKIVMSELVQA
jgi:acyl carrier protein